MGWRKLLLERKRNRPWLRGRGAGLSPVDLERQMEIRMCDRRWGCGDSGTRVKSFWERCPPGATAGLVCAV